MALRNIPRRAKLAPFVALMAVLGTWLAGCWAAGSSGLVVGEEHVVNYAAPNTFDIVEDVLRSKGILFDIKPQREIVTLWMPADTPASLWANLVGVRARYRYEIRVAPQGSRQSKIIANVRTEDIAESQLDSYKASNRLDLFSDFNRLAAKFPPPPSTPTSGGVNFTLLPGENLRAFARRVTGKADNWREIARDNGLNSPTDLAGVQSLWVSDTLMPRQPQPASPPSH